MKPRTRQARRAAAGQTDWMAAAEAIAAPAAEPRPVAPAPPGSPAYMGPEQPVTAPAPGYAPTVEEERLDMGLIATLLEKPRPHGALLNRYPMATRPAVMAAISRLCGAGKIRNLFHNGPLAVIPTRFAALARVTGAGAKGIAESAVLEAFGETEPDGPTLRLLGDLEHDGVLVFDAKSRVFTLTRNKRLLAAERARAPLPVNPDPDEDAPPPGPPCHVARQATLQPAAPAAAPPTTGMPGLDAWNARWRGYTDGVPLRVVAQLGGRIAIPGGPLALDALLAAAVCLREGVPPAPRVEDLRPIEIPVVRAAGGRFHLASFSMGAFEHYEKKFTNRRFPVEMAQAIGAESVRRIGISGGPGKTYRIPLEVGHVAQDGLQWFCVGDPDEIRALLALVHYLGKRRGVGLGRVLGWTVEPAEPWEDWKGFPIVSPEGRPLRTLPANWPGLVDPMVGYKTISFPYWRREAEEMCAVVPS